MKNLTRAAAAAAVVAPMVLAAPALAQTTVTSFAPSSNTTPGVWFENDVQTGGTASIAELTGLGGDLESNQPLPFGAALLTTDFTDAAKAEVGVGNAYGMPVDIFTTLNIMHSYYKAANSNQNLAAAPSLKLAFFNSMCDDPASMGDCFGTLVYEPTWNGPGSTPIAPTSSNPMTDAWTTVNIDQTTGLFWWTGGFGKPNTAGGPPINDLAGWSAEFSSDFADSELVLLSIGVGSFNQGQIGYFDNVEISHNFGGGFSESYDFETASAFESLGECVSTLIAEECSVLSGRDRATCNHDQQMTCFDLFDVP